MTYDALRRGRHSAQGHVYHVTAITAERNPIFTEFTTARLVVRQLIHSDTSGLTHTLAYVLMPDHIHWLLQLKTAAGLSKVMQNFKGRSSRRINAATGRNGSVWQRAFHDHAIRRDEDLRAAARYIVANPLRAGLVQDIRNYPHWDADWLGQGGDVW